MKYTFHSHFAQDIQDYISLRGSIGYAEYSYDRPLHMFDGFCVTHFPDTTSITQELAEAWCTKKANEKMRTLQRRTVILKGFTKYLISIGKEAYLIPDGMIGKPEKFIPYLYSDHELRLFFDSADSLPIHSTAPNRELVIPVLFRMLYCCGLRPQEVRHLRRCDVNLVDGTLHIVDSKRNKDRIVVMAEELRCLCQRYDKLMQGRLANREFFFQHPAGGEYSAEWIQNQFFRCWSFAGITFNRDRRPRVYDWRHNYATRIIAKWLQEKRNISVLLPYLSAYMGHDSLDYTAYYIHLVPDHLMVSGLTSWECGLEVPEYED